MITFLKVVPSGLQLSLTYICFLNSYKEETSILFRHPLKIIEKKPLQGD